MFHSYNSAHINCNDVVRHALSRLFNVTLLQNINRAVALSGSSKANKTQQINSKKQKQQTNKKATTKKQVRYGRLVINTDKNV